MKDRNENIVATESKSFAVRCIRLYQYLTESNKEFVICKQLLRSGTSIGANIREALRGQSKADFGAKMNIALKEASESEYWLELLAETGYISGESYESIMNDRQRLIRLLTSIVKSTYKSIHTH